MTSAATLAISEGSYKLQHVQFIVHVSSGNLILSNDDDDGYDALNIIRPIGVPMRIINFSDARSSLRAVIDQVVEDADVTVISRRDAPDAVVMSFDHYSSLMETVHLLSSPANAAHLAKSIAQARSAGAQHRELIDIPNPA